MFALSKSPPVDAIQRFYYVESMVVAWIAISISVFFYGVLLHINLNFYVGVAILYIGVVLMALTIFSALAWAIIGMHDTSRFIKMRKIFLVIKFLLMGVVAGLTVWAGVIMIDRIK